MTRLIDDMFALLNSAVSSAEVGSVRMMFVSVRNRDLFSSDRCDECLLLHRTLSSSQRVRVPTDQRGMQAGECTPADQSIRRKLLRVAGWKC